MQEKKIKVQETAYLVDTLGLLLHAIVHPADIQDHDGGILLLSTLFGPSISRKSSLQQGLSGTAIQEAFAKAYPQLNVEIVKRSDRPKVSSPPKRWIVERTFAWLSRCRRLAKDFQNLTRTALTFVKLASIRIMLRRLAILHELVDRL